GLGHISSLLPLARWFLHAGHSVAMAVKDLSKTSALAAEGDDALVWFQAPMWIPIIRTRTPPANFSEMLFYSGFLDADMLLGLVKGWHSLFDAFKPDLLVFDHSPVAILASHGLNIKRVSFGNSFFIPPNQSPPPSFRTWEKHPAKRLEHSTYITLTTANKLLKSFNRPPLRQLTDLYRLDRHFLKCFPELDAYSQRNNPDLEYIGTCTITDQGCAPRWLKSSEKRIFAYLKCGYEAIETLLTLLVNSDHSLIIYCPGLSSELQKKVINSGNTLSETPLNFDRTLPQCDLVINHAGLGTVSSVLLAGVPQLCLPIFAEQQINAMNTKKLGCGNYLLPADIATKFSVLVEKLTNDIEMAQACSAHAERHSSYSINQMLASTYKTCFELVTSD
ncbi:MAG: nucleotide disphospho-sugar-binding domain-containing protein, partial [Sedimenticola sp.]